MPATRPSSRRQRARGLLHERGSAVKQLTMSATPSAEARGPNLGAVYAACLLAGAGAAAIVPTAQATIADICTSVGRSRRFVLASMVLAALASFALGNFEVGFTLFGGQTLGLSGSTLAIMVGTCCVAMLATQSRLLLPAVRRRIDKRWVAATFAAAALALSFTAVVSDAGALGALIAVVGTGVGLIGPVLSYELPERDRSEPGGLLGRQAAAGNLGQALGSFSAGLLFALYTAAAHRAPVDTFIARIHPSLQRSKA